MAEQHVVNGATETGYAAVGALGSDEMGIDGFCSATLVTPRVVLTAAHCIDWLSPDYIQSTLRVFFGVDIQQADEVAHAVRAQAHPQYVPAGQSPEGALFDVAVIVLTAEASTPPACFRQQTLTSEDVASGGTAVGYGCTSFGGGQFGVKHSAVVTIDSMDESRLLSVTDTNPSQANTCEGDSGGGLFVEQAGHSVLVGVHSTALAFVQGVPIVTVACRTDVASGWLLDQLEQVHGLRDVCEINGWYGDGVCHPICPRHDPDCPLPGDGGAGGQGGQGASAGGAGAGASLDVYDAGGEAESCQCASRPVSRRLGWLLAPAVVAVGLLVRRRGAASDMRATTRRACASSVAGAAP